MDANEKELRESISDIREWLVRLDTKLDRMDDAYKKADHAEDVAEEALRLSENNRKRIDEQQKEQKIEKRWQIGTVIAVIGLYLSYLGGL